MEPFFIPPLSIVTSAHAQRVVAQPSLCIPENSVSTSNMYTELERINQYYSSKRRHIDFKQMMNDAFGTTNSLPSNLQTP